MICTALVHVAMLSAGLPDLDIYDDFLIQAGDEYGVIRAYDTLPDRTDVEMTGGEVNGLLLHDTSHAGISGGLVNQAGLEGSSSIDLQGGSIAFAYLYGSTHFQLSSGRLGIASYLHDQSSMDVLGGRFAGHVEMHDNTTLSIHGAELFVVAHLYGNSVLNIYGIDGIGLGGSNLLPHDNSRINLFAIHVSYDASKYILTGSYLNGGPVSLIIPPESLDHVYIIPEPPMASMLLILGGVKWGRR